MKKFVRAFAFLSCAFAAASSSTGYAGTRSGPHYELIYSFCPDFPTCTGGYYPTGVYASPSGDVYGTGNGNDAQPFTTGFIFKLTHTKGTHYSYSEYYDFAACNQDRTCPNGQYPYSLIFGQSGAIYGFAQGGDANGDGIFFKITPDGKEQVLYQFCSQGGGSCSDGMRPMALTYAGAAEGLAWDETSPLYGTTASGGNDNYAGTVFKYSPGTGVLTTIYDFCPGKYQTCDDGSTPVGPVVLHGNYLYGTTQGNASASGIVYRLYMTKPKLARPLHVFPTGDACTSGGMDDGCLPVGGVLLSRGALRGLTEYGGQAGYGTLWDYYLKDGSYFNFTYFCTGSGCGLTDGGNPETNAVADARGRVYGATEAGGANGYGTLFQGGDNPLYDFTATDAPTGEAQGYAVLAAANGAVFWVNQDGGTNNKWGGVYLVTPGK